MTRFLQFVDKLSFVATAELPHGAEFDGKIGKNWKTRENRVLGIDLTRFSDSKVNVNLQKNEKREKYSTHRTQ